MAEPIPIIRAAPTPATMPVPAELAPKKAKARPVPCEGAVSISSTGTTIFSNGKWINR